MPSYSLVTFGCQMNVHDSDRMRETLQRSGYVEAASSDQADVVVLNTCSVREKGEQKLRSEVGRLRIHKRERKDMMLVVAGCVAQQEGKALLHRMPDLDLVLGPDNISELPALLAQVSLGGLPLVRTVFDTEQPQFLSAQPIPNTNAPVSTYVTIMKGCDERCSFCIVPHTRGPERYRPSDEIINEIAHLVGQGTAEVTLLGQTVNSYRDPMGKLPKAPEADPSDPDESEFASLLRRIAVEVPALMRLRYTSPHPRHVTPSLIAAHHELDVLAAHVHLPVQSGSDRVLKRMIRRYTRDEYVARARALQGARPGLTLSTDVIVGFPGETDEQLEATAGLIEEMGFVGVFGFKYSPRPYTPAIRLTDTLSEEEKGRRLAKIFAISEAQLSTHLQNLVGNTEEVLVEGASKNGIGLWSGRTHRNEIVHIVGAEALNLIGKVVTVRIRKANRHSLEADLTEQGRSAALLSQSIQAVIQPTQTKRSLPLIPSRHRFSHPLEPSPARGEGELRRAHLCL